MFDIVNFTLSSAVADAGTETVSYPDSRSQGDYDWTPGKHVLFVEGNKYTAPADFTLTFNANASNITLTNASGGTWAAGSACSLQIDRPGTEDRSIDVVADEDRVRQLPSQLALINLGSPDTLDADGIFDGVTATDSAQSYDASDFKAGFTGYLDVPRNLTITGSSGSNHVCTITGEDEYGVTLVESITASGTSTVQGKKAFKRVVSMAVAAGAASDTVDLGWGDVIGLPVAVTNADQILAEFKDGSRIALTAAALTENSSSIGGTNDGDIPSLVDPSGDSGASVIAGIRECATMINTIISNLGHQTALSGTFVAAVGSEATATTGDVRGTYDPADACDGDDGYMLLVSLTNPNDKGVAQYGG